MESGNKFQWEMVLISVVCVLLGGVLIFFPDAVNEMIAYMIAAAMFIIAIIELYNYFKKDVKTNFYRNDLVFAVVSLVIGIILLAKREAIISLIPVVLGSAIIISGVKKLQNGIDLWRIKADGWKVLLALSAVNIIFGVIMVICALETAKVITVLIGVGLLYSGLTDIFAMIWVSKNVKGLDENRKEPKDIDELMEYNANKK